jgi:hypothetical protein
MRTLSSVSRSTAATRSVWKTACGNAEPSGTLTGRIRASAESSSRQTRYCSGVSCWPNAVAIEASRSR